MTQEKLIKIQAHYDDPGLIERIAANFRRFWIDIKWMNSECNEKDECVIYMSLYDRSMLGNMDLSILTLSKMVDIDYIEEVEEYKIKRFEVEYKKSKKYEWGVVSEQYTR
ncbi:MAG: hypothetical protein QXZ44_04290 [Ferroplasma sp.]